MSAPFIPAPRTLTSTSPEPGSGSGRSATNSAPSSITTAFMPAAPYPAALRGRFRALGGGYPLRRREVSAAHEADSNPIPPPSVARIADGARGRQAGAQPGLARRRRHRRPRTAGAADPGVPGRRRITVTAYPLAAAQRLPHTQGGHPGQRRLLGPRAGPLGALPGGARRSPGPARDHRGPEPRGHLRQGPRPDPPRAGGGRDQPRHAAGGPAGGPPAGAPAGAGRRAGRQPADTQPVQPQLH